MFVSSALYCFKLRAKHDLIIGGKNDNEQHVIGELLALLLEHYTDLSIGRKFHNDGTYLTYEAIRSNQIDVNVEYEGTVRQCVFKDLTCDLDEAYEKIGLKRIHDLGFENGYVLLAREQMPVSKLSEVTSKMRVGYDAEYSRRGECFDFGGKPILMDTMLLHLSLERGQLDVINASSTDGLKTQYNCKVLEDDLRQLCSYRAFVVAQKKCLKKYPEITPIIQKLIITENEMSEMNYKTEVLKFSPRKVAKQFLLEKKLL